MTGRFSNKERCPQSGLRGGGNVTEGRGETLAENKSRLRAWNWADLDPRERDYWSIPSKDVFQFAFHLNKHGHRKIYDLGCGIGRNLFFLIDMGFDLYGSDYSPDAVNEANKYLGEINYPHRVKLESMTEISEPDESCDAVIAYNVVYHSYLADMMTTLKNVYRILRPGGSLLITFQSKRSPEYKEQYEIEPGTVIKTCGHEAGIPHHFVDQEEIFSMLSGYRIAELSHIEHEYGGLKLRGCHFVVTAIKQ